MMREWMGGRGRCLCRNRGYRKLSSGFFHGRLWTFSILFLLRFGSILLLISRINELYVINNLVISDNNFSKLCALSYVCIRLAFVRLVILKPPRLYFPCFPWFRIPRNTYLSILHENLVDFSAGILNQFAIRVEYNQGNFAIAQDAQFIRLLHEPLFSLQECDLTEDRSVKDRHRKLSSQALTWRFRSSLMG